MPVSHGAFLKVSQVCKCFLLISVVPGEIRMRPRVLYEPGDWTVGFDTGTDQVILPCNFLYYKLTMF